MSLLRMSHFYATFRNNARGAARTSHSNGAPPHAANMLLTPEGFGAVVLAGHLAIIAQFVVRCAATSLPRARAC